MRAANWLVSIIKRTFSDAPNPSPEAGGEAAQESQPNPKQEVKSTARQKVKPAGKKEGKMTNPQKDSHLDSLLGEFGLPVEVQPSGVNDEPAEPEAEELVHQHVEISQVTVAVGDEAAAAEAVDQVESGLAQTAAGADEEGKDGDRKRRRRRRRRGGEEGEARESRPPRRERRRQEDDSNDGPGLMEDDVEEKAPEEPFVLEDLSNLQFPAWDELIGGLYRPQDHRG